MTSSSISTILEVIQAAECNLKVVTQDCKKQTKFTQQGLLQVELQMQCRRQFPNLLPHVAYQLRVAGQCTEHAVLVIQDEKN